MLRHTEPIVLSDWSKVPALQLDITQSLQGRPWKDEIDFFGLHFYKGALWTGPYVGVGTSDNLKLRGTLRQRTPIVIQPRFGLDPWTMLNEILQDDEFPAYLADAESGDEPLFRLFTTEKPIAVPQQLAASGETLLYLSFLNTCYALCRKGLKRSMGKSSKNYTSKVRGKINITKNLRTNTWRGRNDRFYCEFPDFTEDNLENRILKSALNRTSKTLKGSLLSTPEIEKRIKYCTNALRHITEVTIFSSDFRSATATGLYSYYKRPLRLAELILKEQFGIPETNSTDKRKSMMTVVPYMINMQLLFELFCRARLKKTLSDELELAPYKTEFSVREKGVDVKGLHLSKRLIPDLIIRRRSDHSVAALFDAKYKESTLASRDDTLQLMAYALATAADVIGFMFPSNSKLDDNFGKTVTLRSPFINEGIPYVEYPVAMNLGWKDNILP